MEILPIVVPLLKKFIEQHNNYLMNFYKHIGLWILWVKLSPSNHGIDKKELKKLLSGILLHICCGIYVKYNFNRYTSG